MNLTEQFGFLRLFRMFSACLSRSRWQINIFDFNGFTAQLDWLLSRFRPHFYRSVLPVLRQYNFNPTLGMSDIWTSSSATWHFMFWHCAGGYGTVANAGVYCGHAAFVCVWVGLCHSRYIILISLRTGPYCRWKYC